MSSITFPRALPNLSEIQSISVHKKNVIAITRSPFTGVQQVQEHQGQWFEIDFQLVTKSSPEMAKWDEWLTSMEGMNKTFLTGDPSCQIPRGSAQDAPGTPLVDGASQTGDTLAIKGMPNNALYLLEGDYIQLGATSTAKLYMVLTDLIADGSGTGTIDIWPNLRSSPADNAAVTVSSAVGVFRLKENTVSKPVQQGYFWTMNFTSMEAI